MQHILQKQSETRRHDPEKRLTDQRPRAAVNIAAEQFCICGGRCSDVGTSRLGLGKKFPPVLISEVPKQ